MNSAQLTDYDTNMRLAYAANVCGTDEAGRGPLAGPVYAAAVVLPEGLVLEGLNDSKKLTPKQRELLFDMICEKALAFSVCSSSVEEIERLNILNASLLAMKNAVCSLKGKNGLTVEPGLVLVDGNVSRGFPYPAIAVVGGDGLSASIAAASVLAKVTRDEYMRKLDETYPEYGFAKHKGYGTKAHCEALEKFGPCPEHRLSFLKKLNLKNGVA